MTDQFDARALYDITYGIFVVAACDRGRTNGQIANTVFQITSNPPRIAVSLNKGNLTHEFVARSGFFGVSVIDQSAPMTFIGTFGFKSGRDVDKYRGVACERGSTGCLLVTEHATAVFEAKVVSTMDAGTHTVFLGEIASARRVGSGTPMTYAYYHAVKKGTAPPSAPTFRGETAGAAASLPPSSASGAKYACSVCGYVYDPAVGDPASGAPPGTAFDDLPDDWVCPVCGVGKDRFNRA